MASFSSLSTKVVLQLEPARLSSGCAFPLLLSGDPVLCWVDCLLTAGLCECSLSTDSSFLKSLCASLRFQSHHVLPSQLPSASLCTQDRCHILSMAHVAL